MHNINSATLLLLLGSLFIYLFWSSLLCPQLPVQRPAVDVQTHRIMPDLRGLLKIMTKRAARVIIFKRAEEGGKYPLF